MGVDVLIIVLALIVVGVFPAWPFSRNWGYVPSLGVGVIVAVLILLLILHVI